MPLALFFDTMKKNAFGRKTSLRYSIEIFNPHTPGVPSTLGIHTPLILMVNKRIQTVVCRKISPAHQHRKTLNLSVNFPVNSFTKLVQVS